MNNKENLVEFFEKEANENRSDENTPEIGIIMGSDSDLETMSGAYDALNNLGFEELTDYDNPPDSQFTFESFVVSAHRTPKVMYSYADTASQRGLKVIIAGAGGKSADLPNMTASIAYPIPVIGVPVQEKSVNSVIGMPKGAPITAVDAGKSYNAALSAVQILSLYNPVLKDRLKEFHSNQRQQVQKVSFDLHRSGTQKFLQESD